MLECFKEGLYWRGIKHDWSKFRPSEFIPYARFFYNPNGSKRTVRDKTGYYKPTDTGDKDFDFAWFLHQKRNDHHWQYWVMPEDEEGVKLFSMPIVCLIEMLCDWKGAGRAQGTPNAFDWYKANRHKLQLHEETLLDIDTIFYFQ